MKKGKLIGAVALVMCLLTGCVDHMPEMTQEQSDLIAEYAADLLLKYSPNYEYRLADEGLLVEASTEAMSEETAVDVTEEATEEAVTPETQKPEKESIHVETDVEMTQESEETQENEESKAEPAHISEVDLAELLAMDGLEIAYDSYDVCTSYPNKPESSGFTVSAAEDKALLIMHFTVENVSTEKMQCDFFEAGVDIFVNVNDAGTKTLMSTLLTNDITTFIDTMDASEKQEIVAVLEIDAEEEIETLTMKISGENVAETVRIK